MRLNQRVFACIRGFDLRHSELKLVGGLARPLIPAWDDDCRNFCHKVTLLLTEHYARYR